MKLFHNDIIEYTVQLIIFMGFRVSCQPLNDKYLTHYWPITNGQMTDIIGNADMTQGNLTSFINDRFGSPNSALNLNGGWTQVPNGIYFNTNAFTISAWVFPQQVGSWARLIDFGNGQTEANIYVSLDSGNDKRSAFLIWIGAWTAIMSPWPGMKQNQWTLLTATFNGSTMSLYINSVLVNSGLNLVLVPTLSRSNCFIGKSNSANDGFSSSYLDDLRFYNKSLTQVEILELMNQNETTGKESFFRRKIETFI